MTRGDWEPILLWLSWGKGIIVVWLPLIALEGDVEQVRLSATDVASDCPCDLHLALKARPKVRSPHWQRQWPPDNKPAPFPLRDIIDLANEILRSPEVDAYPALRTRLASALDRKGVRPLLRIWVTTAVENILDAHEGIEAELGPLRLIGENPTIGPRHRQLTVWAPVYGNADGLREIRRFRTRSSHAEVSDSDRLWCNTAAYVTAKMGHSAAATRIRVVEIGLSDGSTSVLFDGPPTEAESAFIEGGRAVAARRTEGIVASPCSSCAGCKVAGACDALIPVPGMFGQDDRGYQSPRAVSPTALVKYNLCPAQWLLDSELHLPKEGGLSEAQVRGIAVHRWLAAAHTRGVACTVDDMPQPEDRPTSDMHWGLTPEEYFLAYPFLIHHLETCPLHPDDVQVISIEKSFYGFDAQAHLVATVKPDLIYRLGNRIIIRETKTTASDAGIPDRLAAYDRYPQIAYTAAFLANGLMGHLGATEASVELELITPSSREIYFWDLDDLGLSRMAAGDVRRSVERWHYDSDWETAPGPHCSWCPVGHWCPDRDEGLKSGSGGHVSEPLPF